MDVAEIADLDPARRRQVFERGTDIAEVEADVAEIIAGVRERRDQALRAYTEEFDDITIGSLAVTDDLERATDEVDPEILEAIDAAADNIRRFHERQIPTDWRVEVDGRELGRRFRPLERVGAYVPGGTAAYPSSALMTVIPAKVAGVDQVAVTTPPGDPINPVTLAALEIAGADEVYQVGGAQAIAALAYGTETISPVDRIVGPGNPWVAAAKRHVSRDVLIDFVAGPSEILILADHTAEPRYIAADLLAQAEHGRDSPCLLVTDDSEIARETADAIDARIDDLPRAEMAREALSQPASGIFVARSMSEAIAFTESYAPEHLAIQASDDEQLLERIDSAGSVFLGRFTPVAAGDYASGTNHVLPTSGQARVTGGLSVDHFLRSSTVQRLGQDGLAAIAPTVTTLAREEGLDAHAASVDLRLDEED